jgi:pimeloyl-ACP methyl ester carboxylesterase
LYEPKTKTKKVALYLHGNGGSSIFYNALRSNILAEQLNNKNIAFFPFNNRGGELIKSLKNQKEERVLQGSGLELIKDCLKDIDGAIAYLKTLGYTDFYLIGHSTGANKAALYNFYKPKNQIAKFILTGPGDDTGWYYKLLGPKAFSELLDESKQQTKIGNGEKLSTQALKFDEYMSFQSLYDVMNPDGDYNTYPFYEYKNNLNLSPKKLFREFSSISQPTLVIYGSEDEYCEDAAEAVEILRKMSGNPKVFSSEIIKGADHSFHGYEKELAQTIANWLDKQS